MAFLHAAYPKRMGTKAYVPRTNNSKIHLKVLRVRRYGPFNGNATYTYKTVQIRHG